MARSIAVFAVALAALSGARAGAQSFVAGHAYVPIDGGQVVEYDQSLVEVRRFSVAGVQTATGAVFDCTGLVMIGYRHGTERVMEVNATGTIVHEYDTGSGTLLRGSYIDYDPGTNRLVFANDRRLTVLDGSLNLLGSSTADFQRASGVAFDGAGHIYATDQFATGVQLYSSGSNPVRQSTIPWNSSVGTGLDIAADGSILASDFGNGRFDRINPVTGMTTHLVSGLAYGVATDVAALADGTFLAVSYSARLQHFSATGQLIANGPVAGTFDGVAVFVPAPGAAGLVAGLAMATYRRRRVRHS
jgi:hypothetical protein